MTIVGLPLRGVPLKSVIFASIGSATSGRASPWALPAPILDADGHPLTPSAWSFAGEHFLKYLALTTEPFGKRRVVFVSTGGLPPLESVTLKAVRSVRPPCFLLLSLRTYLAVKSTDSLTVARATAAPTSTTAKATAIATIFRISLSSLLSPN